MASPNVLTFNAEGRAVDFEVWVNDLQLFLQCDSRDGVSLFDHTPGVSVAPAADVGSTVRSQWTTHDAAARLAVRSHLPSAERAHFGQYKTAKTLYVALIARYSSPATAALSRLMLPYLFPDLAAFATLPHSLRQVSDHFLSLCPTTLTVDLLEERLFAAEKSIVTVGASRGGPRAPFFKGCSPIPLLPFVVSTAAVDLVGTKLRSGETCGLPHATHRCFGRLIDAWRAQFPDATEIPRWGDLFRSGVAIFDLDYDAILAAMYAVTISVEGDCYLCVPPDPGIEVAALGATEFATPGAGEAALSSTASAVYGGPVKLPVRFPPPLVLHELGEWS
ncbi:unnamed protein product [Closterium sp. NIES-65]|nr:unnamed protein product [Closterium sp. NIES-65]